jgi:hypothetical protein
MRVLEWSIAASIVASVTSSIRLISCTVFRVSPEAFPVPATVCLAPQGKTFSRAWPR